MPQSLGQKLVLLMPRNIDKNAHRLSEDCKNRDQGWVGGPSEVSMGDELVLPSPAQLRFGPLSLP
jgi:hypothetical protein